MKIEDDVPTTMPNSMTVANPPSVPPPKIASGNAARNTVDEVPSVRFSVSLIDRSISSRSGMVRYLRRFSRTRSYTTTLSLVEYPSTVRIAATITRSNSNRLSARKPTVLVMSSTSVATALTANSHSKRNQI